MFEQAFKNIDDVLWKEAGCSSELDYTEQTSWLLFLKYLDGLEQDLADQAALEGRPYSYILDEPKAAGQLDDRLCQLRRRYRLRPAARHPARRQGLRERLPPVPSRLPHREPRCS